MRFSIPAALVAAAMVASGGDARAQALAIKTVKVAGGFANPVIGISPPGDYQRLFIVEENTALIRILDIQKRQVLAPPFLSLFGKVGISGERGLLGLAFHPNYAQNGLFYVDYTNLAGDVVVECYQVSANPNLANTTPVGTIIGPIFKPQENHNGGMIAFGSDGKLYVGVGDGGNFNDTGTGHAAGGNGQSLQTLLGKILRLDVDLPFPHIPIDNPYVNDPNALDPIWDYGVRNPWRFTFDSLMGDIYLADVGQDAVEEIDFEPAGSSGAFNYGWRCMEGNNCTGLSGCTCNAATLTKPIDQYLHQGGCNSVTGGFVYRGCALPANVQGTYFYADYCRRQIWSFTYDGVTKSPTVERTALLTPTGATLGNIAGWGQDAYGEIYILDHSDGEIFKIVPSAAFPDCNTNFIDDGCEINVGGVPDLNGNSVPDDCECGIVNYCTAKSGLACGTPSIYTFGESSAAATSGFFIFGGPARANKSGILIYTNQGRDAQPFQGGTLCIATPLRRGPAVNSAGFATCDGEFVLDMNAFAAGLAGGNPAPYLMVPGTLIDLQWWGRDTVATGSFLSDGGEYLVCP